MDILKNFLDSTYLKTPEQSGLSEEETRKKVMTLTDEAIQYGFYAVMIRPNYVKEVKDYILSKGSKVKVGTVIGFHEGTYSTQEKLKEALQAIKDGADDLDFVTNFEAFKKGDLNLVKEEIRACNQLGLSHNKTVKWIIEIAALTDEQIVSLCKLIVALTDTHFPTQANKVFLKSSTGFYKTEDGKPSGATVHGIQLMLDNAGPLKVKAAGGIRTPEEAERMITMGVKRIGTSNAKKLIGISTESGSEGY